MSEDQAVQGSEGSQTPDGADVNAGSMIDSASAAKLQGVVPGKAEEPKTVPEGEGKAPADGTKPKPPEDKAKEAKVDSKVPPKPAWDEHDLKWLESKSLKADSLDPTNEAHRALIKNARNAESEMSKAINQAKAAEIAKAAKNVPVPGQAPQQRKTEIEKFEEFHNVILENVCWSHGVKDADELAANFPELARRFDGIWSKERQKAWEREQIELRKADEEKAKVESDKARFKGEMEASQKAMEENLLSLKKSDPEIDGAMKKAGVYDILGQIEQAAAWPVSFVLSNPKMAEWFAKAAKAISTMENMDGLKDSWRKEYEADLKKQAEAKLTPAGGKAGSEKARVASNLQKTSFNNGF